MGEMPITAWSTVVGVLGLLALSLPVSRRRFQARVRLGHGRDQTLHARVRAQANFVEYVPLALITLGVAEGDGAPSPVILVCAVMLGAGRLLHAIGMYRGASPPLRACGMLLTWTSMGAAALALAARLAGV